MLISISPPSYVTTLQSWSLYLLNLQSIYFVLDLPSIKSCNYKVCVHSSMHLSWSCLIDSDNTINKYHILMYLLLNSFGKLVDTIVNKNGLDANSLCKSICYCKSLIWLPQVSFCHFIMVHVATSVSIWITYLRSLFFINVQYTNYLGTLP